MGGPNPAGLLPFGKEMRVQTEEDHVRTQGEDGHLHAKQTRPDLRRNQPFDTLISDF